VSGQFGGYFRMSHQLRLAVRSSDEVGFIQPNSLVPLSTRYFVDEYRVVLAVNVISSALARTLNSSATTSYKCTHLPGL
jgi:hypothetical protein